MSNGTTHQLVAAAGIGVILGHLEETTREPSPKPLKGVVHPMLSHRPSTIRAQPESFR